MFLEVGSQPEFSFPVKDHLQLGKELDIFDFDAAAEVLFLFTIRYYSILLRVDLSDWTIKKIKNYLVSVGLLKI